MRVSRTPERPVHYGESYVGRRELARLMGVSVATVDRILAAAQAQPSGATDERLDVEVRGLRFGGQLSFEQVE